MRRKRKGLVRNELALKPRQEIVEGATDRLFVVDAFAKVSWLFRFTLSMCVFHSARFSTPRKLFGLLLHSLAPYSTILSTLFHCQLLLLVSFMKEP